MSERGGAEAGAPVESPAWRAIACPGTGLAESPRWAHGQLRWVDIPGRAMFAFDRWPIAAAATPRRWDLPDEIGAIVPTPDAACWIGLGRQGVWRLPDDGVWQHWLPPPFDPARQRFNDARSDAAGRVWVSTLVDARHPAEAALYCIDGRGALPRFDGLTVGNGLAFAPDGTSLWFADTSTRRVWRAAVDGGERALFADYSASAPARPDGAAASVDGHYWVAVFEGGRIDRWDATGRLVRSYPLPLACPTMPCFAGPERRTLVVTSAGTTRPEAERRGTPAGDLLLLDVDVAGLPEAWATRLPSRQPTRTGLR